MQEETETVGNMFYFDRMVGVEQGLDDGSTHHLAHSVEHVHQAYVLLGSGWIEGCMGPPLFKHQ